MGNGGMEGLAGINTVGHGITGIFANQSSAWDRVRLAGAHAGVGVFSFFVATDLDLEHAWHGMYGCHCRCSVIGHFFFFSPWHLHFPCFTSFLRSIFYQSLF